VAAAKKKKKAKNVALVEGTQQYISLDIYGHYKFLFYFYSCPAMPL
jgi:hypothetical protein